MKFALSADGAQAAGQGIGNVFKALAMGQQVRDKAEQEAMFNQARIAQAGAQARKYDAEAQLKQNQLGFASNPIETAMLELGLPTAQAGDFQNRLATGQWGGQYAPPGDGMGPTMPAPADDDTVARLGQTLSLLQRMYGTGSKVDQYSEAALKDQKRRNIDRVIADPALASAVGMANAANDGRALFSNVGNTGYSLDLFGGQQTEMNPVLAKLFAQGEQAQTNQRNAAARNSAAGAAIDEKRLNILNTTGSLPGTGNKGSEFNVGQIRDDIRADFNAIYPIDVTRERPKSAPSYDEFARQWLRQYNIPESVLFGEGANKNPQQGANNSTMPEATTTIRGKTYVKVNGQWFEK